MLSLGIDPSTTATGVVLLQSSDGRLPTLVLEREINCKTETGVTRSRRMVLEIMEVIHAHKPDKIVVEGYSLNMKKASSVIPLVELGGLLRFMLVIDDLSWFDPRAGEVKKFATGKGNTPKDKIMMFVLKRWAHESFSNNTADAYVLACMGLAHSNKLLGATLDMRTIAGAMKLLSN